MLKYYLTVYDSVKLYVQDYYMGHWFNRISVPLVLALSGYYFYLKENKFFHMMGMVALAVAMYHVIKPWLRGYFAFKGIGTEAISLELKDKVLQVKSHIKTSEIEYKDIDEARFENGYGLIRMFEETKLLIPAKRVTSGNIDDFIQSLQKKINSLKP